MTVHAVTTSTTLLRRTHRGVIKQKLKQDSDCVVIVPRLFNIWGYHQWGSEELWGSGRIITIAAPNRNYEFKTDDTLLKFIYLFIYLLAPIPVASRSKAWVCGRSLSGTAASNPAGGMDVSLM
jgi:hypothetical protein